MNKSQRMQLKAILSLVGVAFLIVIAIVGIRKKAEPKEHIPQIETFQNVWIMEVTDSGIKVFDGEAKEYPWQDAQLPLADKSGREQVADITVTDGLVTELHIKNQEKLTGKVVSVTPGSGVELQDRGFLPFAEDVAMYRLYNTLEKCDEGSIRIGYSFDDFVMENGQICAVLVTREEAMEYIRVQIKGSDYSSPYHESITLTCDTDFVIRYGVGDTLSEETHTAGEQISIAPDSGYFASDRIYIQPAALTGRTSLLSVNRSQGVPAYRGSLEIVKCSDGLAVVNELLLEEYLYAVVPSEMPSSYPLEALKAQAICARTYAYGHMLNPGIKAIGAHVDDSTTYQVYNNITEQDTTTTAVKETSGQLLYAAEGLADTYYYSTSCGFSTDANVWKSGNGSDLTYLTAKRIGEEQEAGQGDETENIYNGETMTDEETFSAFIQESFAADFESQESWYRWSYEVSRLDADRMLKTLQKRYVVNEKLVLTLNKDGEYTSKPIEKIGNIKEIYVSKRNEGGIADELIIEGESATVKVITEHNIRYVLCDGVTKIKRQDGSEVEMTSLLPSAFFTIITSKEDENVIGYSLTGGGFGHGVGMSQNGAKAMAAQGYSGGEILQFFYSDGSINKIY